MGIHVRRCRVILILFVLLILLIFLALLGYTLLVVFLIFPFVELAATVVEPTAAASLCNIQLSVLVGIEPREQVVRPVPQRVLIMEELLYRCQICVYFSKPCLNASGNL